MRKRCVLLTAGDADAASCGLGFQPPHVTHTNILIC